MVEQLIRVFEPVSSFVGQHVPVECMPRIDVTLVAMLVVGVLASTLGAKLARPIVTLVFIAAGVAAGLYAGPRVDLPLGLVLAIAVVGAAAVGYAAFRLWVGVGAAALLVAIGLLAYGSQRVVPALTSYEESRYQVVSDYVIPDVAAEETDPWDRLENTSKDFWTHLKAQDADIQRNALLIVAGAGVLGLVLGCWAVRFTLVAGTALLGTVLVASSLALALHHYRPDAWGRLPEHAAAVNGALLAFLGASVLLQGLLTRRRPVREPAPPA